MRSDSMGDCGAAEVWSVATADITSAECFDATQDGHARGSRAGQRLFPRRVAHARPLWTRKTSKTLEVIFDSILCTYQQSQWHPGKKTFLVSPGYVGPNVVGVESTKLCVDIPSSFLFLNCAASYSGLFILGLSTSQPSFPFSSSSFSFFIYFPNLDWISHNLAYTPRWLDPPAQIRT